MAYTLGLKSVAIYRDGSKLSQPLQAQKKKEPKFEKKDYGTNEQWKETIADMERKMKPLVQHFPRAMTREEALADDKSASLQRGDREYLPWMRINGFTQKVHIGDFQLFLTANPFPDGRLGEFYMEFAGQGSVMRAMGNLVSILGSLALQYGMPAEKLVEAFRGLKFEPSGVIEGDDKIRLVSSVADYVGRKLGSHFLGRDDLLDVRELKVVGSLNEIVALDQRAVGISHGYSGDVCTSCHSIKMIRNGTCLMCEECGSTTGCG
jgi:ribonucleoside-diphosphate reductase alpha chain